MLTQMSSLLRPGLWQTALTRATLWQLHPHPLLSGPAVLGRRHVRRRRPPSCEGIGGSRANALPDAVPKRFTQCPDLIVDEAYVRLNFKSEGRETLAYVESTVFTARKLLRVLSIRPVLLETFGFANRFPLLRENGGKTNKWTLVRLFKKPFLWPALLVYRRINIFSRGCCAAILPGRSKFPC
jgi:hypothetical protein